jgi:hypothetical protein
MCGSGCRVAIRGPLRIWHGDLHAARRTGPAKARPSILGLTRARTSATQSPSSPGSRLGEHANNSELSVRQGRYVAVAKRDPRRPTGERGRRKTPESAPSQVVEGHVDHRSMYAELWWSAGDQATWLGRICVDDAPPSHGGQGMTDALRCRRPLRDSW